MNDIAQIIVAIATLVSAIGALILGVLNRTKIEQVHQATNSKMDSLIKTVGEAEKAKGVIEGRAGVIEGRADDPSGTSAKPMGPMVVTDVAITAEKVSVARKP